MNSTHSPAAASLPDASAANGEHLQPGGAWRASIVFACVVMAGFGLLYSFAGAGLGRVLFPEQAQGSLIVREETVVGSALVPQPFTDDRYFASRPSAANYDPMAAAGSNQARSNPELRKRVNEAVAAVAAREGVSPAEVPGDLVTQSGGGLDPHISPAAARIQMARVARARGLDVAVVRNAVDAHVEAPQYGLLGQPRVNVLELNLALDTLQSEP